VFYVIVCTAIPITLIYCYISHFILKLPFELYDMCCNFFLANVIKKRSDDDVVTCESSQCFHKNGIEMSEEYLKFTASEVLSTEQKHCSNIKIWVYVVFHSERPTGGHGRCAFAALRGHPDGAPGRVDPSQCQDFLPELCGQQPGGAAVRLHRPTQSRGPHP
jgi:hypothetical protein